jgi:hypothetical protein
MVKAGCASCFIVVVELRVRRSTAIERSWLLMPEESRLFVKAIGGIMQP